MGLDLGGDATSDPAVLNAPDTELQAAISDLVLAARVLGNLLTSIEVVLDRVTRGGTNVEPAGTPGKS